MSETSPRGSLPAKPQLAPHALARRHLTDGIERVVLHDVHTGGIFEIGAREWTLLEAADGTRDLDGILAAAQREGAFATREGLEAFLQNLHDARLLATTDRPRPRGPGTSTRLANSRPLERLPGYLFTCDGRGGCCGVYPSILFTAAETARARALRPDVLDGADRPERVFLPVQGSAPHPQRAVAMIDGRCAYLADDDRCSLHAKGGSHAKPDGCRLYPATFVDDGETVRVSAAPECTCVLTSADVAGGDPLIPAAMRTRGDLEPVAFVQRVPEQVAITSTRDEPRARLAAWSRAVSAALRSTDVAATVWALADHVAAEGFDVARGVAVATAIPAAVPHAAVRPWIETLAVRAAGRAREDAGWRSERDLARHVVDWLTDASVAWLEGRSAKGLVLPPEHEALFVRAAIFGHHLLGAVPFSDALRDMAVRLWVARAMHVIRPDQLAAGRHPLALLEAVLRGHGLGAYVTDVEGRA